jgi:hypothetical protein
VMVENASASTTPALKRNFIGKTPPAEVVNGRQAAMEWRAFLRVQKSEFSTLSQKSIYELLKKFGAARNLAAIKNSFQQ